MSIKISNLTKKFDDNTVLKDVSIDMHSKGIYAIIGRSGTGKSTLINILSGLDSSTSGGVYLGADDEYASRLSLQRSVAVIYQEHYLMNGLTVYENIEIAMQFSGKKADKDTILRVLKHLNLDELADRKVEKLSGGEKQRVAIARAYLADKNIIVADEPTGNLDDENAEIVYDLLKKVSRDKIVIVVSHDRVFVEKYADKIYEIEKGEINCKYECLEVLEQTDLESQVRNKSVISRGNYLRLVKHIAFKKKALMPIICILIIIAMTVASIAISMNRLTYGDIIMNNTIDEMSRVVNISYSSDSFIFDENVDVSVLESHDISYNKGLTVNAWGIDIGVDYSDEYENMYYYLFDEGDFTSLIELDDESGIVLCAGTMPKTAMEVTIPEYFVEQLMFFETDYNGKSIKVVSDIIGENLHVYGTEYVITGVHKSDKFYAEQMEKYIIDNMSNQAVKGKIENLRSMAKTAPSLTSLYFGQGFRSDFMQKPEDELLEILHIIGSQFEVVDYDDLYTVVSVDIDNLSASRINEISKVENVLGTYTKQLNVTADRTGTAEEFIYNFIDMKSILLAIAIILMLLSIVLSVLMINLQYKGMQKDIGIMMSFGAKKRTILGLFSVIYSVIFVALTILALGISALLMPLLNSIFGVVGLSIFTWNIVSLAVVAGVSLVTVGGALLIILLSLKRKNLIENLRA